MTKEELFPQDVFPRRRRRVVEIPQENLHWELELYFSTPEPTPEKYDMEGIIISYSEINGPLSLVVAEREGTNYVLKNGHFIEISEAELEQPFDDFGKEFEEKNGKPTDDANDLLSSTLDENFDEDPWESF